MRIGQNVYKETTQCIITKLVTQKHLTSNLTSDH